MLLKLGIILILIVLNGFFAMSELAVVSARKSRLRELAGQGQRGAAAALRLAEDPGRFLSAVQVGISLVGILAGAFGGAALAGPLAEAIASALPSLASVARVLALAIVVGGITYLSLIIGELVPKQLALRNAERLACFTAPALTGLARMASPLVTLLDWSTEAVLRLLGGRVQPRATVSDAEIRMVLREAAQAGVVEPEEQEMIVGVMRLADRPVGAVMTPRPNVDWIDVNAPDDVIRAKLRDTRHSRLLVCDGDIDNVLGAVQAKDILNRCLLGQPLDLRAAMRPVAAVPESTGLLKVLELLKRGPVHLALVVDEYGSLLGIVTTADLFKVIAGGLVEYDGSPELQAVRRNDGSWLLDGRLPLDEVSELLELPELQAGEGYHTLAGWLLARLDHLPQTGERLRWRQWIFEVVDMDGYRIDKILAIPSQ
ncbi:MAG: HlyC/CorC family transporter [Xanthomonadaceae bacterium]|nr:HlyC/CorC family transporter [Xanthomonadaceae bacterium]